MNEALPAVVYASASRHGNETQRSASVELSTSLQPAQSTSADVYSEPSQIRSDTFSLRRGSNCSLCEREALKVVSGWREEKEPIRPE